MVNDCYEIVISWQWKAQIWTSHQNVVWCLCQRISAQQMSSQTVTVSHTGPHKQSVHWSKCQGPGLLGVYYRLNGSPKDLVCCRSLPSKITPKTIWHYSLWQEVAQLERKKSTAASVSCSVVTTVCLCFPSGIPARPSSYPRRNPQRKNECAWKQQQHRTPLAPSQHLPQCLSGPAASTFRARDV